MTSFNTILSTETDPDAPLTAYLAKRWSDNLLASFEGAPGAPRLNPRALPQPVAGNIIRANLPNSLVIGQNQTGQVTFTLMQFGTIRLTFDIVTSLSASGMSCILRRLRNGGTTVLLSASFGVGTTAVSVDVSMQPFDKFSIDIVGSSSSSPTIQVQSLKLKTTGDYLYVAGGDALGCVQSDWP